MKEKFIVNVEKKHIIGETKKYENIIINYQIIPEQCGNTDESWRSVGCVVKRSEERRVGKEC